jgi:hypothetical protein
METPGTTERPPAPASGVKGVNALAVISVAAGTASFVLGFVFVGAVVAIVTGHIARRQIARTGEKGAPLALAGLVLGYAHLALGLSWLAFILFLRIASAVNGSG